MELKYRRILRLDKKIKELKEKIRKYKIAGGLLITMLLMGCASIPQPMHLEITYPETEENSSYFSLSPKKQLIFRAFKNSVEKLDTFFLISQLDAYKGDDLEGFLTYLEENYGEYTADWVFDNLFPKVRTIYERLINAEK